MTQYAMQIEFQDEEESFLLDISGILYDMVLVHDYSAIISNPQLYSNYNFSRYFFYRNGRPIIKSHRIRTLKIVKQSPLVLEVIIPTLGAVWIMVQIFDKISNWPLNREKLKLEVDKLRHEKNDRRRRNIDQAERDWHFFDDVPHDKIEGNLINRLSKAKLRPENIQIRSIEDDADNTFQEDERNNDNEG